MKLPTLYSRTSAGSTQEWTVEIEGNKYRTYHGKVGGKIVVTQWFIADPTNEGRANYRDGNAQAIFEANACWKKKIESGCFEDIGAIDEETFTEPMLAKKWTDFQNKVQWPLYCQPKFDGARCVLKKSGGFSRGGKEWNTIPHIKAELEIVFREIPGLMLDGELYNHEFHDDFGKIMSLIKRKNPNAAELAESKKFVQFYCYDICDDKMIFSDRSARISEIIKKYDLKYVIPVATHLVKNLEELDELYGAFLEDGYEGQIVRVNGTYEFKRSDRLLKRKEFMDDEYKIVEIIEGKGNKSGLAGKALMEREDGVQFRSNIKGKFPFLKDLFENRDKYVGTWATCQFFQLSPEISVNGTPGLIPRFPYLIRLRAGKGQD